jgi:hypothetical protein
MNLKKVIFASQLAVVAAYAFAFYARADENFSGRVYDIDYLGRQGWTQVLFKGLQGASNCNLVAMTKSDQLQRVLRRRSWMQEKY